MHHILGITDKREDEIAKEIIRTLNDAGRIDAGAKKLTEIYPAEAFLAGMLLMQMINLNMIILAKHRADIGKQNAAMN
jgi:hypothetical protein